MRIKPRTTGTGIRHIFSPHVFLHFKPATRCAYNGIPEADNYNNLIAQTGLEKRQVVNYSIIELGKKKCELSTVIGVQEN